MSGDWTLRGMINQSRDLPLSFPTAPLLESLPKYSLDCLDYLQ